MSTGTIEAIRLEETCAACGEERTLELSGDGEVQIGCDCRSASALS